ncbi:MAG: MFS transporter, partial [Enterococcus sp.]
LKIKQQAGQLIIESNTSNFVRHSLELINEAETDPTHQKIKETIRRSDGHWAWENNGKEQSFKIILTL